MFRHPRDWPGWAQAVALLLLIIGMLSAIVLLTRASQEPDLDQTPSIQEQVGPVHVVDPPPPVTVPPTPTAKADIPAPPPKPPTTTTKATTQPAKKAPAKPAGCDWMREYTKATLASPGPNWEIGPLAADEGGMYYPSSDRARIHRIVDCEDVRAVVFHEWGHYQQDQVYGSIEKAREQLAPFGGIELVADCVAEARGSGFGQPCKGKPATAAAAMIRGVLAPNTER